MKKTLTILTVLAISAAVAQADTLVSTESDYVGAFDTDTINIIDDADAGVGNPPGFWFDAEAGNDLDELGSGWYTNETSNGGRDPGIGGGVYIEYDAVNQRAAATTTKPGKEGVLAIAFSNSLATGTLSFDYMVTSNMSIFEYAVWGVDTSVADTNDDQFKGVGMRADGPGIDQAQAGEFNGIEYVLLDAAETTSGSGDFTADSAATYTTAQLDLSSYDAIIVAFGMKPGFSGTREAWVDNVSVVPEPATMSLLGLGGLVALRRRRR